MSTAPSGLTPPVRPEYEHRLEPFTAVPLERALPWHERLWQQGWIRKGLILALLALLWEFAARWQDNELLLPTFTATMRALVDGLASGELLGWIHHPETPFQPPSPVHVRAGGVFVCVRSIARTRQGDCLGHVGVVEG